MAAPPKNRVLAGERVSRAAIDAAPAATPEAIRAAVAACDYDRAAVLAFARARRGEPVELADVMPILPGLELWSIACALIAIGRGDRVQLLELLERRRFPRRIDSGEIEAIVLYAAWRASAPRDRLIAETRRLSVRQMTVEGFALVATVGAALDDANVAAAVKHLLATAKEHAAGIAETDRALARTLDQAIAALPPEVEIPDGGGFTVRAAKQVGRNDPCPCGSGQKFKRCCADKPVKSGSPIAGVSWDEFLTTAADRMTVEHIDELALVDLARVDLARLAPEPAIAAFETFCAAHEWDHAERAFAIIAGRADVTDVQRINLRDKLVFDYVELGDLARARVHYDQLPEDNREMFALDFTSDPAELWRTTEAWAHEIADGDDRGRFGDLAYGLLRRSPRLGIVIARAVVGSGDLTEADVLLEAVEDARDRLNLPPGDPAWDVLDALGKRRGGRGRGDDSAEATELRESLAASAARADELERSLAATRAALDASRVPTVAELARARDQPEPVDPSKARSLEVKVRELEAMIRDGNAERRELRRQLQTTAEPDHEHVADTGKRRGAAPRPAVTGPTADEAEDALGDSVTPAARPVSIPRFDRRAVDAIGSVPGQVAAEAMRTIGALAAGDLAAWRGVKQAKDMPCTVLMARVGIHHRLIALSDGGSLEVVDLVTREQLMTTLKRLRANL
jgi:hypothetical protein